MIINNKKYYDASALTIGGLASYSSCDWPGELTATIFCQGCPWNCHYCHNADLIAIHKKTYYQWQDVKNLLMRRKNLLDGVVFSGGEPLIQPSLKNAIEEIKNLNYKVGLHTAGTSPQHLKKILPYLDWVGFDVKESFHQYQNITQYNMGEHAKKSLQILLASKIPYEVRTTVHPDLLSSSQLKLIAEELLELGVKTWVLQPFRTMGCRDNDLNQLGDWHLEETILPTHIKNSFQNFLIRQ